MTWRDDAARLALIEAAVTAYRARDAAGTIRCSPAWRDLDPTDREIAFDLQLESRLLERALDPDGLSATARAVLARME